MHIGGLSGLYTSRPPATYTRCISATLHLAACSCQISAPLKNWLVKIWDLAAGRERERAPLSFDLESHIVFKAAASVLLVVWIILAIRHFVDVYPLMYDDPGMRNFRKKGLTESPYFHNNGRLRPEVSA